MKIFNFLSASISASIYRTRDEPLPPQKSGQDFSLFVESRDQCPDTETTFCKDGSSRACAEWNCENGVSEFSSCTAVVKDFLDSTTEEFYRTCSCHTNVGPFNVFTGCKWKEQDSLSTSTTTTSTTISNTTSTISTTTKISTTSTTTTKASSMEAERMLFDIELLGSHKNNEEELESEYEEEEEYDEYKEEYAKALLNRNRAYPISGIRKQRKLGGGMGKTITREDGTYVHAFEMMQSIQRMMFEDGLFSIPI